MMIFLPAMCGSCPDFHCLDAQIALLNDLARGELLARAGMGNTAILEHVDGLGSLQNLHGVLLGDQDGEAIRVYLLQHIEDCLDDQWRETERRLIENEEA